ncbi:delta-class carbonic anhydrase [Glaciecola sp. 2405UD65-10]|uniref:delta-class carbonic anhydrase n=1 Tax=Glaciecola sp. 2405UD65-10 TaxID=3397244 RepID=UPI003B5950E6
MTQLGSNKKPLYASLAAAVLSICSLPATADDHSSHSKSLIKEQRALLAKNTDGKGFGPQSPRDIDAKAGANKRLFGYAVPSTQMNLCNIHFHKNAEHKGGEFTTYAGDGDGKGHKTGFKYSGSLSSSESTPANNNICAGKGDSLMVGDTIELHYVYSSASVTPGPSLGACLAESTVNPGLRVEGQVFVLVNDDDALDFADVTAVASQNGYHQAVNIPSNTGTPVEYLGSTTGPAYNEKASPLQVSWSVRPKVAKVDINSVGEWCESNIFNEDHAHGVRNLVVNEKLLSPIN